MRHQQGKRRGSAPGSFQMEWIENLDSRTAEIFVVSSDNDQIVPACRGRDVRILNRHPPTRLVDSAHAMRPPIRCYWLSTIRLKAAWASRRTRADSQRVDLVSSALRAVNAISPLSVRRAAARRTTPREPHTANPKAEAISRAAASSVRNPSARNSQATASTSASPSCKSPDLIQASATAEALGVTDSTVNHSLASETPSLRHSAITVRVVKALPIPARRSNKPACSRCSSGPVSVAKFFTQPNRLREVLTRHLRAGVVPAERNARAAGSPAELRGPTPAPHSRFPSRPVPTPRPEDQSTPMQSSSCPDHHTTLFPPQAHKAQPTKHALLRVWISRSLFLTPKKC